MIDLFEKFTFYNKIQKKLCNNLCQPILKNSSLGDLKIISIEKLFRISK